MKIGAAIMVHNMAPFIGACVRSLSWTNGIYLYNDHSTDGTISVTRKYATTPLVVENSKNKSVAFKKGELEVRNYVIKKAFSELKVDVLLIVDADELISSKLKPVILKSFSDKSVDSIAFTTWQLYTRKKYIHFWETKINGTSMIDPHTRVIKSGKIFTPLFENGSHPIILPTKHTKCFNGPYHFHLKYYHLSTLPNYSIFFLPKFLTKKAVAPYLRNLPFNLPKDISKSIGIIKWTGLPRYKNTPHYSSARVKFTDPKEALIHPKDKNE